MSDDRIRCPKCASDQIHTEKQGFSTGKAVAGALVGGVLVGAAAGGIGRQKVLITCLKCGHRFKSGEQLRSTAHEERIKGVWVGDTEIRQPYKCHHCGKISSASVSERNCPACGTPYSPKDLIHTPTQKEINETNGCLAIFIAVLCILLIVLFVLLIQKCS